LGFRIRVNGLVALLTSERRPSHSANVKKAVKLDRTMTGKHIHVESQKHNGDSGKQIAPLNK